MLDRALVEEVLSAARRRGGSFAEVFVEETIGTSIRLDDGKVEELTTGLDRGAGVRVAQGTSYGYAYSNRLDRDALLEAAEAASAALREGDGGRGRRPAHARGPAHEPRSSDPPATCRRPTRSRGSASSTMPRAPTAPRSCRWSACTATPCSGA